MSASSSLPAAGSLYIHGTTSEEQARLDTMNQLLNQKCLAELHLKGGERILEVGSGLGQFARLMARTAGVKVLGIERSSEQIRRARELAREASEEHLVEFREGLAESLPLADSEWSSFDVAHARFILEHVRDPLSVVRGMVRAVRTGGRIALVDDDHDHLRLFPEVPGVDLLWRTHLRVYDRLGNDPYIGRRLVALLHQAGAKPSRCAMPFFGSCSGMADFAAYVENLIGIFLGARQPILDIGTIDDHAFDETITNLRTWGQHPDAAFWYILPFAEGVRVDA